MDFPVFPLMFLVCWLFISCNLKKVNRLKRWLSVKVTYVSYVVLWSTELTDFTELTVLTVLVPNYA